jgi:hypothetical protein
MAYKLPIVFRKSPPFTASFDWVDATTGLGYRRYYAAGAQDSAGVKHFLTTEVVDSSSSVNPASSGGAWTENNHGGSELDIDFDIEFLKPAIVGGGIAYFNITYQLAIQDQNGGITVTVYHVDSEDTETSIGTTESATHSAILAALVWIRDLVKVDLTETNFKAGDKLRVNVITHDTEDHIQIWHDPGSGLTATDINGRTVGTDFTCDIPFKVDL